jgi:hypothetical protein
MTIKSKIFFVSVIIIFVTIIFLLLGFYLIRYKEIVYKSEKVCIRDNCFEVEIAENFLEQSRGLMFRKSLADNTGMLFVFDKDAIYSFWMKNTKIPLDIIWINSDNEIVYIFEFAEPCRTFFCPKINPNKNAKYVLEINAGLSEKFNFKIGDQIKINN